MGRDGGTGERQAEPYEAFRGLGQRPAGGRYVHPLYSWLWDEWTNDPLYSHGPMIVAGAEFLAWRRWEGRCERTDNWGFLGAALGPGACGLGPSRGIHFLSALSSIVVLLGIVLYFWGPGPAGRLRFPALFAAFAIPLPAEKDFLGRPFSASLTWRWF